MTIAHHGDVAIRELMEADLEKLTEYADNERVSINLRDAFPQPYTLTDARNFWEMVNKQQPKTFFAIEYKGNYAGNIGLSLGIDVYRNSAEIGYFIGEPLWNRGIMTQAVNMMVDFGFSTLGVVRIYASVFEFNKASQRVLEKCGFEKEAILKKAITKKDIIYDEVRYAKINC